MGVTLEVEGSRFAGTKGSLISVLPSDSYDFACLVHVLSSRITDCFGGSNGCITARNKGQVSLEKAQVSQIVSHGRGGLVYAEAGGVFECD